MSAPGPAAAVTPREDEVLRSIGRRLSNGEIAHELGISKRTVESHVSALLAKLAATDRLGLVRIAAARSAAADPRSHAPGRPPAVGRDDELRGLVRALDRSATGRGALVAVAGEPGIGKTRLVEDLVDEARRRGHRCLVGRCAGAEAAAPPAPVVEIVLAALDAAEPARSRAVDGRYDRARGTGPVPGPPRPLLATVMRATVAALARTAPLLVVVEEVHRADPSTLLVLERVAAGVAELPLLVVLTHRDPRADPRPPLGADLARLVRSRGVDRLRLVPLDEDEVGLLLTYHLRRRPPAAVSRTAHRLTGGNPARVAEFAASLDAGRSPADPATGAAGQEGAPGGGPGDGGRAPGARG